MATGVRRTIAASVALDAFSLRTLASGILFLVVLGFQLTKFPGPHWRFATGLKFQRGAENASRLHRHTSLAWHI